MSDGPKTGGKIQRRDFLFGALAATAVGASALMFGVGQVASLRRGSKRAKSLHSSLRPDELPIARIPAGEANALWLGNHPERMHASLWNLPSLLTPEKIAAAPRENTRVVVAGGGIAGLTAAYSLADLNPILLEADTRLGGNSQGEEINGAMHALGAAYINELTEGSETHDLLKSLDLLESVRWAGESDGAGSHGGGGWALTGQRLASGFWEGQFEPAARSAYETFARKLHQIYSSRFPDVPYVAGKTAVPQNEYLALDQISFADWIKKEIAKTPPPLFQQAIDHYCISSFGAWSHEISAAQALNFISSDHHRTGALPGGNGAIAHRLAERLGAAIPSGNIRTDSLVARISRNATGVEIIYLDSKRELRVIEAEKVVVALPKFVAKHVIADLPATHMAAWASLEYRPYVVANLILKKPVRSLAYDALHVGEGAKVRDGVLGFTDVIFSGWALGRGAGQGILGASQGNDQIKVTSSAAERSEPARGGSTAGDISHSLTLYRAIPQSGRRPALLGMPLEDAKTQVRAAVQPLLRALELADSDITDIRVARWGHALPLAKPGLLASGVLHAAAQPLDGRVYFAGQDVWANPCFETAVKTAYQAARAVRG